MSGENYRKPEKRNQLFTSPCGTGDTVYVLCGCDDIPLEDADGLWEDDSTGDSSPCRYCVCRGGCSGNVKHGAGKTGSSPRSVIITDTVAEVTFGKDQSIRVRTEKSMFTGVVGKDIFTSLQAAEGGRQERNSTESLCQTGEVNIQEAGEWN